MAKIATKKVTSDKLVDSLVKDMPSKSEVVKAERIFALLASDSLPKPKKNKA